MLQGQSLSPTELHSFIIGMPTFQRKVSVHSSVFKFKYICKDPSKYTLLFLSQCNISHYSPRLHRLALDCRSLFLAHLSLGLLEVWFMAVFHYKMKSEINKRMTSFFNMKQFLLRWIASLLVHRGSFPPFFHIYMQFFFFLKYILSLYKSINLVTRFLGMRPKLSQSCTDMDFHLELYCCTIPYQIYEIAKVWIHFAITKITEVMRTSKFSGQVSDVLVLLLEENIHSVSRDACNSNST